MRVLYGLCVVFLDINENIAVMLLIFYEAANVIIKIYTSFYVLFDFGFQLRMVHYLFIYNDYNVAEKIIKIQLVFILLAQASLNFVSVSMFFILGIKILKKI